ncbi:hypothetical protein Q5P01_015684 [Channa striata]|uniref:Coiled-coil domain-containing protein 17 n=1 Tax=Channa striata TaxID=64152 RepID=A0AA88MCM8_CHASR|nr:hypothetical protein Q5P01_015684 [Channa striata]
MEKALICADCNMVFRSAGLLGKHKALFCIGSEVGDLRVQRHGSEGVPRNSGGGIDPREARSPELVQMRGQQRSHVRMRGVDAEPKSGRNENKPATGQTNSAALQNLTKEFHKLRTSIEENMSRWSKRSTDTEESGRQLGHSERLQQMREMATLHERQLALIRVQHQQLEQQRDELTHQVSALSEQSNTTHLEHLLLELREQEERNEETLQQLSEHLRALHLQQASVPADQPEPHKNEKMHVVDSKLVSSVDGPLSNQIKALRHAYMQSGGSDPAIVAHMIDLQAEAQSLERNHQQQPPWTGRRVKPPRRGPSWELLAVEQENQRLEEEILRMQLARGKHRNYEAATTELDLIQQENLQQIISLRAEMERSKEALRPDGWHRPPLHKLQTKTHPTLMSSPFERAIMDPLSDLGPAPYDPAAGFVVFFDLVMGVDVSQRALCLVAALYSEGHEVRSLTLMSPVRCLLGGSVPNAHKHRNYALFAVKQPVPRIQPSASLCLVVEVQAAKDLDVSNQEVLKLVSCGWTQLELFDQHNQLRSGFWKVPVRSLPVRPSLSIAQLNSIPQVGNMELCVRLVNGRDEDAQTAAKPDLITAGRYKYPAVVSSLSAYGNQAVPALAPQSNSSHRCFSLIAKTLRP